MEYLWFSITTDIVQETELTYKKTIFIINQVCKRRLNQVLSVNASALLPFSLHTFLYQNDIYWSYLKTF